MVQLQAEAKIVRFAKTHRLKIAMRGQGHSRYGQTLVEGGIVVDSSTLNAVKLGGARSVDALAGASWGDVTRATLAEGLTPPAMGDTMSLSVGGILSAGGVSNSSHLFGGVVDHVEELDVVTGVGNLVTCSPQRNRELFELALAGMGQCGLIVRARLRLVAAPKWVVRRDLDYDDVETFLFDLRRLATEARVEHLGAYVLPWDESHGWRFRINIGKFAASPETVDWAEVQAGLRFKSHADPVPLVYSDYLERENARNAALAAALKRTPSRLLYIAMFVPGSIADDFVARILATPRETEGMTRFSLYVLPTRKFARPMFVLPEEELALNIWLFRGVPVGNGQLALLVSLRSDTQKCQHHYETVHSK
jgi:cytokinin dehydrogenase